MAAASCRYPVTVDDVGAWMREQSFVGADKLAATLAHHEIDGQALRLLEDDDIYRMFPRTGAAIKVRSAVHRLRALEAADDKAAQPVPGSLSAAVASPSDVGLPSDSYEHVPMNCRCTQCRLLRL
jgi:hypothetical protein